MRRTIAAVTIGALLLGACGSDDDGQSAESAAFCGDFLEVNNQVSLIDTPAGDPEALVASVEAALGSAPEEIESDVETMAAFAQSGGEGEGPTFEEFQAAEASVLPWLSENCEVESVDVTAVDYAFEDMPDSVDAGALAVSFTNEGAELHEMVVVRINDGVDMTAEELLALPEEEALSLATPLGAAFADPGDTTPAIFDLNEPGNYFIACFIPVGLTPEAAQDAEATGSELDGPPHFTQGMFAEFTVD